MLIIDQEKINQEIQWLDESTIIFQNKIFKRGFDLSPNAYKKSLKCCSCEICEEFRPLYLVLEHPHYLTIWIEEKEASLANKVFSSPINSDQPKFTDVLSLKTARSEAETPRHLDSEESRNHNQFPTPVLPDSLPEDDVSASEASIVTQNPGYWHNSTESDSPENPKVPTGNLDQEKVVSETAVSDQNNTPKAEGDLNPSCQQITKQSVKRVSKKKYRGICYEVEAIFLQLPTDAQGFVIQRSKKKYRGISY
ncbi:MULTISPECIES: hypothetical protein [Moorena]|uniref:Uncharacterized protein n=1 Tax=Moorena producens 3L TaxID=489825 RepID=F4XM56_9CYAN|nr:MULTISPECIES: hypothetical protein [Moorena]EGJ34295.1 hypothetical protein LYNGBM3L_18970 [Moorena producens 3L]NEP34290.1 hypothetical protein [Moorena sp. SIO3B2]NEP65670.1 hypothetical protein [Moorena sp. SIO3A5]NEQ08304.1 hypothetical protein [Moorena sp. SIO4E2]NER85950.1 hypothetical protein [Moorena sp. SIO3A2]